MSLGLLCRSKSWKASHALYAPVKRRVVVGYTFDKLGLGLGA
jgi:hypothetical protein